MKISWKHASLLLVIALVLAPWATNPVAAQSGDVQMSAKAAFNGVAKYGEWLPVWVDLENQGQDLDAEIRVRVNSSSGATTIVVPVPLPAGARKRVPVYTLPNNFTRELEVQLVSKNELIASTKLNINLVPNITFVTGLVSAERGALALLSAMEFPTTPRQHELVDLTIADLPERREGLRSFDLLVFNDIDTSSITPEQQATLVDWVEHGGRLVIGGGAGSLRTLAGLPDSLRPITVEDNIELDTDSLAPLADFAGGQTLLAGPDTLVTTGQLNPACEVLVAATTGLPLLCEQLVHGGYVDFVALDLAQAPFAGWPSAADFWTRLTSPTSAYPMDLASDMSVRQMQAGSLEYPLTNLPVLDLPSIQGLAVLLLAYILLVGPVNYLVLRRFQRLHLAWFTIPALTLLFTGASFGIGLLQRGTNVVLNRIALIELRSDGNANVRNYVGIFSPSQESYRIQVDSEGLVSPMVGYSDPWAQTVNAGGELEIYQTNPSELRGLAINQWSMQRFMSEDTWEGFGQLEGDLRLENETLVGTVRNNSNQTIRDAAIVVDTRVEKLGDLAPGQEVEIDLGLSALITERYGPPLSYVILEDAMGGMSRTVELKRSIIDALFSGSTTVKSAVFSLQTGISANNLQAVFLGWVDSAPGEIGLPGHDISIQTTGLVYSGMPIDLSGDSVSIPVGLLVGTLQPVEGFGKFGACGPSGTTSVYLENGIAEFAFRIPNQIHSSEVTSLTIATNNDMGTQTNLTTQLYNWQTQEWDELAASEDGMAPRQIPNPQPSVDPTGQIRLQISTAQFGGCNYIDLGLTAEPAIGLGE